MKKISLSAFSDCENLKQIKLYNNLECLGKGVFYGCKMLNEVIIPDSIKKIIWQDAFIGFKKLEMVV